MTLKEARKAKGLTLDKLAAKCGTSKAQLSHIENGTRNPSTELLKKLTAVLGNFDCEKQKVKFSRTGACEKLGEIYGYLHKSSPDSSKPADLAYAVEHPIEGFIALYKKFFLVISPMSKTGIWINEQLQTINPSDFEDPSKAVSEAEQTAFLIGYYKGIKKTS